MTLIGGIPLFELKNTLLKNTIKFAVIALIIYLMRDLFDLFLFTFLFTYLIYNLQKFIVDRTHINKTLVAVLLYIIIVGLIVFIACRYIPEIVTQIQVIIDELFKFKIPKEWTQYLDYFSTQIDVSKSYNTFMNTAVNVGQTVMQGSINVFISLMLSMFFVLDMSRIKKFVSKFKTSKISSIYEYLAYFGTNFLNSFGKVIQAQFLIATANSILSTIALFFMGFPQSVGLGFMIFILSFIPVAGTVISLVPLSLIAFEVGGIVKVISVIIMVALLHLLESYVLNPKLMSDKTSLPIFFIFMILIIGKHFMGVWGLLLGIPLFMFLLDILDVKLTD